MHMYCVVINKVLHFLYTAPTHLNIWAEGGGGILELLIRLSVCHTFVWEISSEPLNRCRGGSVGRASDSRSKDPRFESRQEHKKNL